MKISQISSVPLSLLINVSLLTVGFCHVSGDFHSDLSACQTQDLIEFCFVVYLIIERHTLSEAFGHIKYQHDQAVKQLWHSTLLWFLAYDI
jgi:hypothetical protein